MPTGATEFIDSTTADVFIPEIWSVIGLPAREQATLLAALVNRQFEEGFTRGDIKHVPTIGNLAVQSKAKSSNAAIVMETITETNTDITVATWEYCAIGVESIIKVQANRDMLKMYASKQYYALALAVDDVLAGLIDDFTQTEGTLAVGLRYDDYVRADQYLDDANAPQEDRFYFIAPAEKSNLLKMQNYISDDYSTLHGAGPKNTALRQGYLRSFLGRPVYVSTNVEGSNSAGHDNGLMQKEALALVLQLKPTPHAQYDIHYLVDIVLVEQLYGTQEMRDNHGVWLKGA